MSPADGPLAGRVVLLTRPEGRGEVLAAKLRDLGARVEVRATIALVPPLDPDPARRAAAAGDRYDWIVFTSPTGVKFFFDLHTGKRLGARVAAIGPSTARDLERHGVRVDVVARDSRSEGLAAALHGRILAGHQVLLVQPEVTRPVLRAAITALQATADAVTFYRNVAAPGVNEVVRDVLAGRFDAIVLTSPSTLQRILEAQGFPADEIVEGLRRSRLVAIGAVTAAAIRRNGIEPASVAAEPVDEAVVQAVVETFSSDS